MEPLSPNDFNLNWAEVENWLGFASDTEPAIPELTTPAPAPPEPELEALELEDLFGMASPAESVPPEPAIPELATPAPALPEPELEALRLEDLFGMASPAESVPPEPAIPELATPAPEIGVATFAEPRSANQERPSAMPLSELPLPPVSSPQGLWAEIGHLFPTSTLSEPVPPPPIEVEINALSQALLANDGDTIQALVNQIQQNHADQQSIEILLAATRNWCR
ncbi:MAG: hypothetical protein Q6J33_01180 [Gloeomargarita sp. DG_2_bins_126]